MQRATAADLDIELRPQLGPTGDTFQSGPLLLLALTTRDNALGLVYLMRGDHEPGFDHDEGVLVEDLCDQAAVALGNALHIRSLLTENEAIRRDHGAAPADGPPRRQLRHLDAMAALASGLAHDYDNLISIIQMCANLRWDAVGNDAEALAELEQVRAACERASELTPLLSTLTRRQVLQPELLDPAVVVEELREGWEDLFSTGTTLHINLEDMGRRICADRSQFVEALTDLVVNACRATQSSGAVYLRVYARHVTDDDLLGVRPGPYTVMSIEDDGAGMEPKTIARIARPFFPRRTADEGSGVGLATVMAFAHQNEGTVTVASVPGRGSTVSMLLPIVSESMLAPAWRPTTLDGVETILLVVKDFGYRGELRSLFRRYGYQVLDVHTPRQAVDVADAFDEPIHLLVVDVGAAQLSARLHRRRPEASVLPVVTAPSVGRSPPSSVLMRGLQEPEVLVRVRRALIEASAGLTDQLGQ